MMHRMVCSSRNEWWCYFLFWTKDHFHKIQLNFFLEWWFRRKSLNFVIHAYVSKLSSRRPRSIVFSLQKLPNQIWSETCVQKSSNLLVNWNQQQLICVIVNNFFYLENPHFNKHFDLKCKLKTVVKDFANRWHLIGMICSVFQTFIWFLLFPAQ